MKRKVLASVGLVGLGIFIGVLLLVSLSPHLISNLLADEQIGAREAPVQVNSQAKAINDAYEAVSTAVRPTVVSISVVVENKAASDPFRDQFRDFFRFFNQEPPDQGEQNYEAEASGSGVIISGNGYIVTNNHVVENAREIKVKLTDNKDYTAKLVGRDPLTDLAVIKIEGSGFPVAHFSNIEDVKIGEMVLAVGNPLGLNSTVTAGIVSAIGRGGLSLPNATSGYNVENFIQTDAAINPGNSGGGLFDLTGSLVGINSAIATRTGTYIGYGFAIPVDLVKSVALDLIEHGKVNRGYIGVKINTITASLAKALKLDKVEGAVVQEVMKDSPARKAGIEMGDVILKVDGKSVRSSNELQGEVAKHRAGDAVTLDIWRDGSEMEKTVTLEPRDTNEETASNEATPGESENYESGITKFDKLGFTVQPLTSDDKKLFGVDNGLLVTKVDRYGAADNDGLYANGVIVKADRKPVKSSDDLKKIINNKKSGDAVLLQVKYKNSNQILALEIP